jgi:hypothetical protein
VGAQAGDAVARESEDMTCGPSEYGAMRQGKKVDGVVRAVVADASGIPFARRRGSVISRKRTRDLGHFRQEKEIYIYYRVSKIL